MLCFDNKLFICNKNLQKLSDMTKAFLLNLNKKALFFLYCLFAITYEKRLPKLVRQPL